MSLSFFDAIKQGNRYEVERQLIFNPSLMRDKEEGLSPVMVAAYHRQQLHAAAQNGDEEMIRTLLYGGADLSLKGNDGKLPHELAQEAGHAAAVRLLEEGITKRFKSKW
ncbi:MAG: hypothetical protein JW730_04170 [Anaerolineales bacterium]|nr:hypothetical protein [Anaerolineales bacterium]